MGAAPSHPTPNRWRRAGRGLFTSAARARARTASTEQQRAGASSACAAATPVPSPLSQPLSDALTAIAAGGDAAGDAHHTSIADLRASWEADQATLLTAVRALTAAVTGVGPAAGGDGGPGALLSPSDAAALTADPDAAAVAAAAAAARSLDAEAALKSLLARHPALTLPALAARAADLGWDAAIVARRAAAVRALFAACDGAATGMDGWVRCVDQGYNGLTVDYRTLRPDPAGPTLHALVMNDIFPCLPPAVLAITRETDLVRKWNAFCTAGGTIEPAAPPGWARVGYAAMRVLPPFPTFDICVKGVGHDVSGARAVAAATFGQPTPDESVPEVGAPPVRHPAEPPGAAGCHRVTLHPGSGLLFLPCPPDPSTGAPRTLGTLAVCMHLHLPYVPAFLVRWVVTFLLPLLARQLKRHLAGPWFAKAGAEEAEVAPARRPSPRRALRGRGDAGEAGLFADRMAGSFTYRDFEAGVAAFLEGGLWPTASVEAGEAWLAEARRSGRVERVRRAAS